MADADFRARFPNARIHKNDWVDPGDGSGLIDSIRGFNKDTGTGEAWQWLTEADAIAGADKPGAAMPTGSMQPSHTQRLLQIMQQQMAMRNALRG